MNSDERSKQFEIEACIDLKQGKGDFAAQVWCSMLVRAKMEHQKQSEDMDVSVVKSLQNLLLCAARSHKEELFQSWLRPGWDAICQFPFLKVLGYFLLDVAFVVGDRRIESCLPDLQVMIKQYRRICQKNSYSLNEFMTEWLNLSAQMMVRGVDKIPVAFVQIYLRMLYFCTDWNELRRQLWKYYFYTQGLAQEYGLEKTLEAYGLADCLMILLYERTFKTEDQHQQRYIQSFLFSCLTSWILSMAAVTKSGEMQVANVWKHQAFADSQVKLKRRFNNLYDGVTAYRQLMRPRKIQK